METEELMSSGHTKQGTLAKMKLTNQENQVSWLKYDESQAHALKAWSSSGGSILGGFQTFRALDGESRSLRTGLGRFYQLLTSLLLCFLFTMM